MRWFSAGQRVTLARALPERIVGRSRSRTTPGRRDRCREECPGSGPGRLGGPRSPAESAPPVVSVPIDGPRAPTNRWRPTSTKNAARSRMIGPPSVTASSLVENSWARLPDRVLAGERLVLEVAGDRSLPAVRPRAGDHVHQAAGEAAVPHVERSGQHLQILDRLDGEHPHAGGRAGRAEPGDAVDAAQVHGAGPVDLQAVEPVGLPGDRDPGIAAHHRLRREQHQLGEVPVVERERGGLGAGERLARAGPAAVQSRDRAPATVSSASCVTAGVSAISTRRRSPSESVIPVSLAGRKPMARASIAYGPPTERYSKA